MSTPVDNRSRRPQRTGAEWAVFVVAAVVLAGVLGAVTWQWVAHNDPAAVSATVAGIEHRDDRFVVSVEVHNDGDRSATDVGVSATLDVDGTVTTGDDTIEFLAGGRTETIEFLFRDDPSDGDLTVAVINFRAT